MRTPLIACLAACLILLCRNPAHAGVDLDGRQMVIANRAGGSLSVIDVASGAVLNVPLPAAANTPEPMYLFHSPNNDLLFVGDRANNRVVAFNPRTYSVVNPAIPVGNGVFHMWGSAATNQMWVVNDVDRTLSVLDMVSFASLGTVPAPADLGPDARPHDLILSPAGDAAFISMVSTSGTTTDAVIRYTTAAGFGETGRQLVGKAPHLGATFANNLLYVPSEGGNEVAILDRSTFAAAAPPIAVDNAHGITLSEDGGRLYVTSFPGDGTGDLHTIDTATNALLGSVSTPNLGAGPHNVAVSSDDARLYITHSGSTFVSVFDISGANRDAPLFLDTVETGANPFGLYAVPGVPEPATLSVVLLGLAFSACRRRAQAQRPLGVPDSEV